MAPTCPGTVMIPQSQLKHFLSVTQATRTSISRIRTFHTQHCQPPLCNPPRTPISLALPVFHRHLLPLRGLPPCTRDSHSTSATVTSGWQRLVQSQTAPLPYK